MKNVIAILAICFLVVHNNLCAQESDSLIMDSVTKTKLNKQLIKMAKKVVLKHGPGYYREYKEPVIKYRRISKNTTDLTKRISKPNMGKVYYTVEYPYDHTFEIFQSNFSAKVYFWEDLTIFEIDFGHGNYIDYTKITRSEKRDSIIPYERVRPYIQVHDTIYNKKGEIIEIRHSMKQQTE